MDENSQNLTPPEQPELYSLGRPSLTSRILSGFAIGGAIEAVQQLLSRPNPFSWKQVLRGATVLASVNVVWHTIERTLGLHKEENHGKVGKNFIAGAVTGASFELIESTLERRPASRKAIAIMAGIVGAVTGGIALFHRKPLINAVNNTPASIVPPSGLAPDERILAVAEVPQILDMLVSENRITAEQKDTVLAEIKNGRKGFAGEIAVANGFVTSEQLQHTLIQQSAFKAEAAISDINGLSQAHGAYAAPTWLKANWGNNGVNPTVAAPTRTDGAAAAANNAQNLVMLAYANPHREILPIIQAGIVAAANLTRGLAQGSSAQVPLAKMADSWTESMDNALVVASQANPDRMVDANGAPVDIHAYIAARNAEIKAAIQQTLQNSQQKDNGHGR